MLNRTSFANVKIFLSPTSVIKHLLAPFLPHEKKICKQQKKDVILQPEILLS